MYQKVDLIKTNYGSGANSINVTANVIESEINISANYDTSNTRLDNKTPDKLHINGVFANLAGANGVNGGAINNSTGSSLGKITANFYSNISSNYINYATIFGGAIYNDGSIDGIEGHFIGNTNNGRNYYTGRISGGAIYNESNGIIGDINGDFIANRTVGNTPGAWGGAICNNGKIQNITGNFISNKAYFDNQNASNPRGVGGAIANTGTIQKIKGDFINNEAHAQGSGYSYGGAIGNTASILGGIEGDFIKNSLHVTSAEARGGALYNDTSAVIKSIKGNFVSNYITDSGNANTYGGAIDNRGTVTEGIINSSFFNNYVTTVSGTAYGGAIYTTNNLDIVADNASSTFKGNYIVIGDTIDDNAIYIDSNEAKMNFVAKNNGQINLYDNIRGVENYNITFNGDTSSNINLNNYVYGPANVTLNGTNLNLGKEDYLNGNNVTLNSGNLSLINNKIGTTNFASLNIANDTNFYADVDLANAEMDRVSADIYSGDKNIVVSGFNLLSESVDETTKILFADQNLKDKVTGNVNEVAYSPIYKYNVTYDNSGEEGYFVFDKYVVQSGGSSSNENPSVSFNPAVLGSSTSATVGATATVHQTFNYAFNHSDFTMNIPQVDRLAMRDRNKYALSVTGDATDMGRFTPLYQPSQEEASVWVKPYATFETVGLKNGPKVHNNTYGTLVGFDTEMQSIKNGWDRVFTGYIGYNGASQRYAGIDSTQNGGLIGGTMTLYKGNFFNATTVSVGASVANNQTMYGSEDFAMLLSGIGNKTGYNFEFKEGKLILQPSMLMSYTFVNTFDYTNAAGVRIDNKPLHAIQLAPGVKVIGNLKNGWQPYASVQMVWNLMGESDATANGVKLPEMSIKPYVQYGVGLQKRIKDHFTAYGQAMIQNGGRNGVSLTAGFRWALGHDKCKYKVDKSDKLDKCDKSVKGHSDENQNLTMKQTKSSNGEILKHRVGTENFVSHTQLIFQSVQDDSKCHYEEQSDVVIPSNNAIATPVARNDRGKSIRHSELNSESINAGKTLTPALSLGEGAKKKEILRSAQNDRPERKILKQLSPEQKMALGGKYYNTSRTAKTGSLRQY